jgi:hypothetical protein
MIEQPSAAVPIFGMHHAAFHVAYAYVDCRNIGGAMQFDSHLDAQDVSDWTSFVAQIDAAQEEFAHGHPDKFKALWSHAGDATLIGGLGGAVEVGWDKVAARLDWASTNYADTKRSNETYAGAVGPEFAYIVRREIIEGRIAGRVEKQELRVTMVLRRENGAWRILHRHADSQTKAWPPR